MQKNPHSLNPVSGIWLIPIRQNIPLLRHEYY